MIQLIPIFQFTCVRFGVSTSAKSLAWKDFRVVLMPAVVLLMEIL